MISCEQQGPDALDAARVEDDVGRRERCRAAAAWPACEPLRQPRGCGQVSARCARRRLHAAGHLLGRGLVDGRRTRKGAVAATAQGTAHRTAAEPQELATAILPNASLMQVHAGTDSPPAVCHGRVGVAKPCRDQCFPRLAAAHQGLAERHCSVHAGLKRPQLSAPQPMSHLPTPLPAPRSRLPGVAQPHRHGLHAHAAGDARPADRARLALLRGARQGRGGAHHDRRVLAQRRRADGAGRALFDSPEQLARASADHARPCTRRAGGSRCRSCTRGATPRSTARSAPRPSPRRSIPTRRGA